MESQTVFKSTTQNYCRIKTLEGRVEKLESLLPQKVIEEIYRYRDLCTEQQVTIDGIDRQNSNYSKVNTELQEEIKTLQTQLSKEQKQSKLLRESRKRLSEETNLLKEQVIKYTELKLTLRECLWNGNEISE